MRRRLGCLPGELALFPRLTGQAILNRAAHIRRHIGIATAARSRIGSGPNATALCARCQGDVLKIGRILAFAHRPELQVLDELTFWLEAPSLTLLPPRVGRP